MKDDGIKGVKEPSSIREPSFAVVEFEFTAIGDVEDADCDNGLGDEDIGFDGLDIHH